MKLYLQNFRCYSEKTFDFGNEDGLILLSGPSGVGKCLGKDTDVLMHNGKIEKVQNIKCGDLLMGDDSQPRTVTTVTAGVDQLYEIIPKKGRSYTVNSSHILTLKFDRKSHYEIKDISVEEYLSLPESERKNARTFHTSVFFPEQEVECSPFIVGYNINNTTPHRLPQYEDKDIVTWKNIPENYKINSMKNRLEFLNGLIYRCGIIDNNTVYIYEDRETIRNDIEYIAFSVGLMVENFSDHLRLEGNFSGITCISSKKLETFSATSQPFEILKKEFGEYYGFVLSGNNRRFLLGDFTVTHNTTILHAISFVLYGKGNKLVTVGKKSCKVELEYKNMKITRTKGPNRLVLQDGNFVYEDDAGQAIIDEKFGVTFDMVSYLQQNTAESFILLSPLEKLSFLEKFAFSGIDISKIKALLKNTISKRNEDLIAASSRLEQAKTDFSTLTQPEKVPFPVKTADREKWLKNENIRLKNSEIMEKKLEKTIQNLRDELTARKIYNVKEENLLKIITTERDRKKEVEKEYKNILYEGDEKLSYYESQLEILLSQREYESEKERYAQDQKRLEEMRQEEIEKLEKSISSFSENLWKDNTEEECKNEIENTKEYLKDLTDLEKLQKDLEKYRADFSKIEKIKNDISQKEEEYKIKKEKLSKLKLQKDVYVCPACETNLHLSEDMELVVHDGEIEELDGDIDELSENLMIINNTLGKLIKEVNNLENKSARFTEISDDIENITEKYEEITPREDTEQYLEDISNYMKTQKELEKKISECKLRLQTKQYSSSYTSFMNSLNKQKERLKILESKKKGVVSLPEEELRNKLITQRKNKERKEELEKTLKNIKINLEDAEKNLEKIKKNYLYENRDETEIENDIQKNKKELEEIQEKKKIYMKNLENHQKFLEYKQAMSKYQEKIFLIEELEKNEITCRKTYTAVSQLKEKVLLAESIAITNVIESINAHAQEYLDMFFPVDPIIVRLCPFRENKKSATNTTKPQINLQIDYKGLEADINMLSGGELSRVVLAFTLALCELFNSPLLLLDECTASLDQELTGTVINSIKRNFPDKLVIVIAHQVVDGIFDRVVKL